jgi:uncharacterized protein YceH (UPF0502 family)
MLEAESSTDVAEAARTHERKWQPLNTIERRVLGVLVEKAKTTPDNYPMTLNALTSGCNQKSNRDPQMSVEPHQIEEALENLRRINAVAEVQSDGRVPKFRHYAYEWLGVDKLELAVMAELLLRGPQTVGELRGRASRMDPISDLAALRPVLDSLIQKGLVIPLTPEGRGQIVSHNLYPPEQLEKLKRTAHAAASQAESSVPAGAGRNSSGMTDSALKELQTLRVEFDELKSQVARLKSEIENLWSFVNHA